VGRSHNNSGMAALRRSASDRGAAVRVRWTAFPASATDADNRGLRLSLSGAEPLGSSVPVSTGQLSGFVGRYDV
jgi:hypothetical protein